MASKRAFEKVDVSHMAKVALDQVCVLACVCSVGKTATTIRAELESWWSEIGMDMLVGSDPYADIDAEDLAELDDDIGEAVGEPGADTEEPISADNAEKQELLESLQAAVQYVEAGKALAGLQGLTEDTGTCAEAASSSELPPSSNADPEASESEEEVDNAPATLRDDCCFTLQDILKSAGLSDFSPLPDDHESRKLQRIRKLLPHSQNFCAFVRVGEKILSRALVMGVKRRKNRHNLIQHALAQARLTYSCCSTRQSRQALWRDYADRVVKESAAITGNSDGAQVPKQLGVASTAGARSFQLIMRRPLSSCKALCGLRLAVVVAAFRAARGKSGRGKSVLVPSGTLPAQYISTVHVMLLTPWEDPKADSVKSFIGTPFV